MNQQDIQAVLAIISYLVGAGAGVGVKATVDWLIEQMGNKPSPFATRWITYFVSFAYPTVLYLSFVYLSNYIEPTEFNIGTYVLDILAAFGVATFVHGQQDLSREAPVQHVPGETGETGQTDPFTTFVEAPAGTAVVDAPSGYVTFKATATPGPNGPGQPPVTPNI